MSSSTSGTHYSNPRFDDYHFSDTKLLSKSLISEITTPANDIFEKPQGLRALVYLLAPRTRRHFMPAQIASLEETDVIRAHTSKKDPEARSMEIRKFASEALLKWISEKGAKVVKEPRGSLIVTEVMLYAEGGQVSIFIFRPLRD